MRGAALAYVGRNLERVAPRLVAETRTALERALREGSRGRTAMRRSTRRTCPADDLSRPLVDGLFLAEDVFFCDVEWNPQFVALATSQIKTAVTLDEIRQGAA